MGVDRQARLFDARRPEHASRDVGIKPATLAKHPHGQHLGPRGHARHPDLVVGGRRDDAGYFGAVPGTVLLATVLVDAARVLLGRDPVARVGRVGVAPSAVIRVVAVADHVVARKQLALEIRVAVPDARVEDRHDDACADGFGPGRFGVGGRPEEIGGSAQVPLADLRPARLRGQVDCRACREERVIRCCQGAPPLVSYRPGHVRV